MSIKSIVATAWNSEATTNFITQMAAKSTNTESGQELIKQTVKRFLDSMWLTALDIRRRGNALDLHFNIYAKGNTISCTNTWTEIRCFLASQEYTDPTQGKGIVKLAPFHCAVCHAVDHPRGLCPFPDMEGWNSPKHHPIANLPRKKGRTHNSFL
jgi:hypothetical protein